MNKSNRIYVQYGCGLCAPEGWTNFDSSPRLRFERILGIGAVVAPFGGPLFPRQVAYGDIAKGLPVESDTVDGIYASHVLEHLARRDVPSALLNTFRILKSGGVFRMIVPDLEWRARRYVEHRSANKVGAADCFIEACGIGVANSPTNLMGLLRSAIGNSGHSWMYDEEGMRQLLVAAGFIAIRRCDFHDSGDAMFDRVEDRGRFYENGERELALEGRKP